MKKRMGIIFLFILLFIGFIIVWNYSFNKGLEEAYVPLIDKPKTNAIPTENGMFKRFQTDGIDYTKMPIDENHQRGFDTYYDNRAYPGAPPTIPHPVKKERSYGGNTCTQCHQYGGYVDKFEAYAPITPHPEMVNCRQCHVAKKTTKTFKPYSKSKMKAPEVGEGINNALLGSPPMIPHTLHMRENCISCHAGPSAPKEIRVSHPERINCRQCHVPTTKTNKNIDITGLKRHFDTLNEKK